MLNVLFIVEINAFAGHLEFIKRKNELNRFLKEVNFALRELHLSIKRRKFIQNIDQSVTIAHIHY